MVANEGKGRAGLLVAVLLLPAAGLGGLVWHFHSDARVAEVEYLFEVRQHKLMVDMKKKIEQYRLDHHKPKKDPVGGENIHLELGAKARKAQLPENLLQVTKGAESKSPPWKETPYTVNLRSPTKDNPIPLAPLVDFLGFVEDEIPNLKSKNLTLVFSKNDFTSVTLQLSHFQRQ